VIDEDWRAQITTSTIPDFDWDKNGMTADEYFIWRFNRKILHEISSMIKGKFSAGIVQNIKLGTIARLLFFHADPSLKRKKALDMAIELVRNVFYGDQSCTKGTPEYAYAMTLLKRLRPVVRIAEKKLSSKNEMFKDIPAFVAELMGKEQKIDNNAVIDLKRGIANEPG